MHVTRQLIVAQRKPTTSSLGQKYPNCQKMGCFVFVGEIFWATCVRDQVMELTFSFRCLCSFCAFNWFLFYIIWHWFWLVFGSSRGFQSIVGFGIYRESVWLELKKANYSDLWSLPGLAHVPKTTFWTLTHNIYRHKSSRKYFNNYLKISLK